MSVENGFVQPEEPVSPSCWASSSSVLSALIFAFLVYCELNWTAIALTVIAGHVTLPHNFLVIAWGCFSPEVFLPLHFVIPRTKCLLPISLLASAAGKQCSVWAVNVISTNRSMGISLQSEERDLHPLSDPLYIPVLSDHTFTLPLPHYPILS